MRADRSRASRAVAILTFGVLFSGPAGARSPSFEAGDHCTYGDAKKIAHAYYALGYAGTVPWGDGPLTPCEFRAFYTPHTEYCFCEHDNVFGGDNFSTAWTGGPRSEWPFSDVTARFVITPENVIETEPIITPIEGTRAWDWGDGRERLIRKHYGVLYSDLVPGIYDVTTWYSYGPFVDLWFDHTFFRVLPHDEAHGPELALLGTAVCPLETACDNDLDDDGDGLFDCDDYNCRRNVWGEFDGTDEPCFAGTYAELGDEVTTPLWQGNTTGASDDWVFPDDPCGFPGGGYVGDAAAHWTVPETGTWSFAYDFANGATTFWPYLGVYSSTENECGQGAIDDLQLQAGDVVTLVVDGGNVWDEGPFSLTATHTPNAP